MLREQETNTSDCEARNENGNWTDGPPWLNAMRRERARYGKSYRNTTSI